MRNQRKSTDIHAKWGRKVNKMLIFNVRIKINAFKFGF